MTVWDRCRFLVDAAVRIEGDDQASLEPLMRYSMHPPLALKHL